MVAGLGVCCQPSPRRSDHWLCTVKFRRGETGQFVLDFSAGTQKQKHVQARAYFYTTFYFCRRFEVAFLGPFFPAKRLQRCLFLYIQVNDNHRRLQTISIPGHPRQPQILSGDHIVWKHHVIIDSESMFVARAIPPFWISILADVIVHTRLKLIPYLPIQR